MSIVEPDAPDTPKTAVRKQKSQEIVRRLSISNTIEENLTWDIPETDIILGKELGAGSFGKVYKALYLGLEICVKEITTSHEGTKIDEFDHEVRMLRSLRHPLIVLFMGISHTKSGHLYIVQEFVSGGSLLNLLQKKEVPIAWLARIKMGVEISEALSYLHARGVIHRDLKAENILLEKPMSDDLEDSQLEIEYRCKVADFGLATLLKPTDSSEPTACEEVGSVWWRAPEIFRKKYDKRCDYFSFGVVMAEIITRDLGEDIRLSMTVERKEQGEVIFGVKPHMLKDEYPQFFAAGPTPLFDLAIQCCQENPDDRPESKDIVNQLAILYQTFRNVKKQAKSHIKCNRGVGLWVSLVLRQETANDFSVEKLRLGLRLILEGLSEDFKTKTDTQLSEDAKEFLRSAFFSEKTCPEELISVEQFGKFWSWWKKSVKVLSHPKLAGYVKAGFVKGMVSTEKATRLLKEKDHSGTFLFRLSSNQSGLVLTCYLANKISHIIIHLDESGFLIGNDFFASLPQALDDPSKGLNKLTHIYPDFEWKKSEQFLSLGDVSQPENEKELVNSYFDTKLDD